MMNGLIKAGGVGLSVMAGILGVNTTTEAGEPIEREELRAEVEAMAEEQDMTVKEYVDFKLEEEADAQGVTVDALKDDLRADQEAMREEHMAEMEEKAAEAGMTLEEFQESRMNGRGGNGMNKDYNKKSE